ncbi:ArnT family glycosyltransferase [Alistipes sp. HGB5]|uniref:ArnT family glycosyltransferase n=1 Tax=Alistipes sp. HGB5 TaxID=908612 RepID=UPI0020C74CC2|nr:glycosyltransferase family 39 protein [Alistipes sp. HGB5]
MRASVKKIYASLRPDALVAFWLGVWWICNLFQAGFTELANDEAYYHMFAENLSWGYFDHPPMTALLVWLGEHLFGGEFGVRFFFTLLQPLYLFVFWRIIRPTDADRRDAGLFVMLSAATLMLQLYGFIAVPDGPLMMTAALFLLTFKWFTEGRRAAWLWMGVAMALMAYSKYHGALVVLFALAATPPACSCVRPYISAARWRCCCSCRISCGSTSTTGRRWPIIWRGVTRSFGPVTSPNTCSTCWSSSTRSSCRSMSGRGSP